MSAARDNLDDQADMVATARALGASTISEAADGRGTLPTAIRPVDRTASLAGPALPVLSPPGDNLWLHRAVRLARPGDVLVVDVGGAFEHGYWGEVLTEAALAAGAVGLVINGCVRDAAALRRLGFPTFSTGLCVLGTSKRPDGVGSIGDPITVGTATVAPGDLIVGDEDGIVAVPAADAARIVARGVERQQAETAIISRIQAGETTMGIYRLPELEN